MSTSAQPLKGIACMVGGGALLTANDAVLKWLTGEYPTGQIMCLRGLFVMVPIAYFAWRAGGFDALRIVDRRAQSLRALLVVAGTFLFVTGLAYLPLADAISITFANPLFLTAFAPALLGERVGWRRWMAVAVGFFGVLVIVRPTGEAIQWAALFPLSASLTGALRDVVTRRMAHREHSAATLAFTTLAVVLAGATTFPFFEWQPVPLSDIGFFALGGLLIGGAHFLLIETFRYAEAALVAPFKYVSMIWAVLFGFVIWGELPDTWTLTGAAAVIGSGLYILKRETGR